MKQIINSKKSPAPIGPYSQAVQKGNTLYVSGQIALDPISGELNLSTISAETELVMKNLGEVLKAANMTYENVLKC